MTADQSKDSDSIPNKSLTQGGAVLVTGGCGYIGSHVCLALKKAGVETIVVDDLSMGFRDAIPSTTTFYQQNCGDVQAITEIIKRHKVQAVIHFAASIAVEESVANPYFYYSNNTCNTLRLIHAVTGAKVPSFIFSSTAAVYGTPTTATVQEIQPIKPESPYGHSKAMSEQILQDLCRGTDTHFVILRYFNVAGSHHFGGIGQRSKKSTHLIKVAAEVAVGQRSQMVIYGSDYPTPDGTCVRDYIHVDDLAQAHLAALKYLNQGGTSDIFNCGYGKGYSVKEVLKAMTQVCGRDLTTVTGPRRAGDAVQIVADPAKLMHTMDWTPRYDNLKTIVQDAYQWELKLTEERFPGHP